MKNGKRWMVVAVCALPLMGLAESTTNVVWKKSIGLGATYKDGNTEKTFYTANLKGDRTTDVSEWINALYAEYGRTRGVTETEKTQTEGQVRGDSEYKHKFGNTRMYGSVNGEALHNAINDISYRVRIGPNIGYYLIQNETMTLDASIGLNYQFQRVAGVEDDFASLRGALRYVWTLSETAEYYLNISYNAALEDTDLGDGLLVTGIKSRMTDQLSLYVELRDEYDNAPATDLEHNDITVLAGLNYDF
jgi:putative salt-induced outer membrane protein YdiY